MKKIKILLSAFACDPKTGSEPYVGWNWAAMLADDMTVHVITRKYSRPLIGDHVLSNKVVFHYFDLPFCSTRDHHWRFIKPYYLLWQLLALPLVWRLNQRHGYNIIQHLTYNNIDVPGFLWLCSGAHFIWGPVGGGQTAPNSLRRVYGRLWWKERVRSLLKSAARYNPVVRAATRHASLIIFANDETAHRLQGLPSKTLTLLETAIEVKPSLRRSEAHGPVRVLWLSHVFPRKGLTLAIDAFTLACRESDANLSLDMTIIGDGPYLLEARARAAASSARSNIKILGAIPYEQVQEHMSDADIFLFTSVQDTSGNVILEAMQSGLPVIALDHQGAKVLLREGGGLLVKIGSYEETCAGLALGLIALASNNQERQRLGVEARKIVQDKFTWLAKRATIVEIYHDLVSAFAEE